MQIDKVLHYMKSRSYSFTTLAPEEVHLKAIEKLEAELQKQHGNLNSEVEIANQIYLIFISRP